MERPAETVDLSRWINGEIGAFVDRVTDRCRVELEAARRELDEARRKAREEGARAAAAQAEAAGLRAAFDSSLDALQREQALLLVEQARTCTSLPLDQLLAVFHELGKASSTADALAALVDGLALEFSRVALFRIQTDRLKCTRQTGFTVQGESPAPAIPLVDDSLLTRCIRTQQLEAFLGFSRTDTHGVAAFGGTPACALAMPILFQGAVAGVVYADDSHDAECPEGTPQARAKFGELVYRHARQVLIGLSAAEGSGQASGQTTSAVPSAVDEVPQALRDLALRLADELEREYTANADNGRTRLVCQERLKEQLERSRRLYAERVLQSDDPLEGPMAANFLDQHLIAVARARRDTSFGRTLAALVAS